MINKNYWIQSSLKKSKNRIGILHKQLGIPIKDNIPMSLLDEILSKDKGQVVYYKGKRIPITAKLKKRVNLARNLKRI